MSEITADHEPDTSVPRTPISFRPGAALYSRMTMRSSQPTSVIKRDLERYYDLVDATLATMSFTRGEAEALLSAVASIPRWGQGNYKMLWAQVQHVLKEGNVFGVENPRKFVDRIHNMADFEVVAIIDACERALLASLRSNTAIDPRMLLVLVGLVSEEAAK